MPPQFSANLSTQVFTSEAIYERFEIHYEVEYYGSDQDCQAIRCTDRLQYRTEQFRIVRMYFQVCCNIDYIFSANIDKSIAFSGGYHV